MKHLSTLFRAGLAALLVAVAADGAHAEGMGITEWSARGMGLANGMVARANDASAVAYNPAGITQIPGTTIMFGSALSMPQGNITANGIKTEADSNFWPLPHLYVTHQLNDSLWFGGAIFPRFGLGNSFPTDWPGSMGLTEVAVYTLTLNPNLVWKINEHLSVAAGLEFTGGSLQLKQRYRLDSPLGSLDNRSKLSGEGGALSGNLALHLRFNDQWSMGLTYRSRMALNIHGRARWDQQLGAMVPYLKFMQNADLHGTMSLPDAISLGVMWKPRPNLSFEGDVVYTTWSNYRHLDIYLENPANTVLWQPKYWRDTWTFSASVEYMPVDWLALRAGYLYETSPINPGNADYMVPSNGRQWFTLGAGLFWENWTFDLAYTYIKVRDLDYNQAAAIHPLNPLPGRSHGVHAHNVALSIGYRF